MNSTLNVYLVVATGGAVGAVSRFWLSSVLTRLSTSSFPIGTMFVNILGSFLIGVAFVLLAERADIHASWRPLIKVGFLGAMTTFSTFSLDALQLFQQGHYNSAMLYIVGSVLSCLGAAYIGMQSVRIL